MTYSLVVRLLQATMRFVRKNFAFRKRISLHVCSIWRTIWKSIIRRWNKMSHLKKHSETDIEILKMSHLFRKSILKFKNWMIWSLFRNWNSRNEPISIAILTAKRKAYFISIRIWNSKSEERVIWSFFWWFSYSRKAPCESCSN